LQNDTSLTPTERTEKQLNLLDSALQQIAGQSDDITETIARFEEYLGADTEGTKDLGEGIKGITEDQANLLASYLNAIRADVSYSKALWARMDANLQRIADIFTSSPTLMEYQAQIAANTFNTAQATQDILAELRSVITLDGSDTAIRIYNS
jgi:ABC-type transporter Mla subunit MlaD